MSILKIDLSTYVLKFGKYINMLAVDVVGIQTVNKKWDYANTGLTYLQWLVDQQWLSHVDIKKSIIIDYLDEQDVVKYEIEQKPEI